MVKALYNLLYYQVLVQISCNLTRAERNAILERPLVIDLPVPQTSESILRTVITYFLDNALYRNDIGANLSDAPISVQSLSHDIEIQVHLAMDSQKNTY